MKQTLLIILSSFLATAAMIKAAPAVAEPAAASVNVSVVRTGDLDLSTDDGRRQLDQRLVSAAREVCGTASDADLAGKNVVRQCRHDVLAKAQAKRDALLASATSGAPIAVTASR
jgi:UrcA family protein